MSRRALALEPQSASVFAQTLRRCRIDSFGQINLLRVLAFGTQGCQHALRSERHLPQTHADGVVDRIRNRRDSGSERTLAALLRAERAFRIDTLDDDRLTKDVTFFAERSDFSEELSRLQSHLDLFLETTNKQQAIGRTLEFISQELGRELNTLSAKANDAEISQIVVHCKAELEKIREQVQNVE